MRYRLCETRTSARSRGVVRLWGAVSIALQVGRTLPLRQGQVCANKAPPWRGAFMLICFYSSSSFTEPTSK